MKEFKTNIETDTTDNIDFRHVIFTAEHLQVALMSLQPGEDIGMESHPSTDQFIRVEEGKGKATINGNDYLLRTGDCVVIPQGSEHNIINTSKIRQLKIYTLYSKPMHPDLVIEETKADVIKKEKEQ
jgi:mannose-6-phosphate isomerase-like protein (cupin superfamily)